MKPTEQAERALRTGQGSADAAASGRARYVAEVATLLWPAPRRVTTDGALQDGRRPVREYILVPHGREPRLMLPVAGRPAAKAVLGFNKDRSRKASLLSHVLATSMRCGVGALLLRDRVRVYGDEPEDRTANEVAGGADIEAYLGGFLGQQTVIGLHIGPDRANRKPVAQVLSHTGETLGYAKIGVNKLTRELVRAERTALETLAGRPMPTVRVPVITHAGQWNGLEILMLDPLPVWSRHAPFDRDRLLGAVQEIAGVDGVTLHRLADSPYFADLRARAAKVGNDAGRAVLSVLGRLAERAGGRTLPFGAWHGDFTAWNLALLDDTVLVWDWERFGRGVPVGYDAVHYFMQDAITEHGTDPERAADEGVAGAAGLLAPLALSGDESTLVALLYLAELGTRYLTDRQDEAGARLGRLHEWLLPVLTAWSERVG